MPNYLGFRKQKSDRRDDPSGPDFVKVHRIVALFSQPGEWQKLFSLFFSREEEQLLFRAAIFAQQKTNAAEQESDRHVIKATKEVSMQPLILLAVVSMVVLYVLTIVGCLCYVGRHGHRTS